MLRVLHLLNYLGSGGTEKYIYSLAQKLHGKSCEFHIAYSEDGPGRSMFEELGIGMIPLPMKNPLDINAALRLRKVCSELSVDIIHTHFLRENYISVISKIAGNKAVIINTRHMLFENSKGVELANKFFTGFNSNIIAVSRHVADRLIREGIKKEKISMIYNGVDPDYWHIPSTASFREKLGISADELLITSVSRFSPEKGHNFVLDALRYLRDNKDSYGLAQKKYRFILAGSGPLLDEISEKAKVYGLENEIIFTGYVDNVRELLKASDIFIAHSKNEAIGIAILEAMAAGLPVITTDSGGTSEIVNNEDHSGILIDPGDTAGFAEGLASLIVNEPLRRKYAQRGTELVKERFSLDKTASETYNLYVTSRKGAKDGR